MKRILKWLEIQDAFEKGLIARILVTLCLLFIIFGAVFLTVRIISALLPAYPDAHWTDWLLESIIFIVGLVTLRFIRRDQMQAASRMVLAGLLFVVTLQACFIGNPASDVAGAMGLLLFAILSILLLDQRDRWIAIILVISVFISLNILSSAGYLLPVITLSPLGKTIFSFFVWLSVGIIIGVVLIAAMGAMRREPQLLEQQINRSTQLEKNGSTRKDLIFLSTHDALTGLYNRLFFETELTRMGNSRLFPISIIMADIDKLKKINVTFGNIAGDQMLINVARLFFKTLRQEDIVARYGEDEFAVLLPGSDATIVKAVINRINKQIDSYNKEHAELPIRISMGVSTANQGDSLKSRLNLASKILRQEKNNKKSKDIY